MPQLYVCVLVVLVGVGVGIGPRAHAQTASVGAQSGEGASDAEARSLFEAGRSAFAAGDYALARDRFREAHALSGRDRMLYNIGSAEDRLRNDAAALDAFERYLATTPDAENADEVRGRILALRAAIAERERDVVPEQPTTPAPRARSHTPVPVAGIVLDALAIAAGGAAALTWMLANDRYDALERECADVGCSHAQISEVSTLLDATNVLLVSSIVLAVGGITALILELTLGRGSADDTQTIDARATLRVSPLGLSLEGHW